MKKIRLFALLVVAAVLLCSCNGAVTVLSPSSSSVSSPPSVSSETSFPSDPTTNTEKPSPTTPSSTPTYPSSPSKDSPSSTVDPSSPSTSLPPKEEYTPFVPEEKVVAFTFDDGPDYWTRFILDVIDGTEDKLTFFVTYQAKAGWMAPFMRILCAGPIRWGARSAFTARIMPMYTPPPPAPTLPQRFCKPSFTILPK